MAEPSGFLHKAALDEQEVENRFLTEPPRAVATYGGVKRLGEGELDLPVDRVGLSTVSDPT